MSFFSNIVIFSNLYIMQKKFYVVCLVLLSLLSFTVDTKAQMITLSTGLSSSNYGFGGQPVAACFGLRNNNPNQIILMEIDHLHVTANSGLPYTFYVQIAGSLTGAMAGAFPGSNWQLLATNTISAPQSVTNIFNNLNITVPGGNLNRWAIMCGGTSFSSTNAATPTITSGGGVDLLTYINGIADGYCGFNQATGLTYAMNWPGAIRFIPGYPCTGKPGPSYIVGPNPVCPNDTFSQFCQSGVGFVLDQEYQWQYSTNNIIWNNFVGTGYNTSKMTDNINTPRFYRCIVTCKNGGLKDTTPVKQVDIAPFYYCYCKSTAVDTNGIDVGNMKILYVGSSPQAKIPGGDTVLNNGSAEPVFPNPTANKIYSNFQYSGPEFALYKDSTYDFIVTQINKTNSIAAGTAALYLDWNRDGIYDTTVERLMQKQVPNATTGVVSTRYTIPHDAQIGKTGFRVVLNSTSPALPCDGYNNGETEDYISEIKWEPCSGKVDAGVIEGDSSVCVNYDYLLTDSTYEKRKSAFTRMWQVSGDNIQWFYVAGSKDKDTLTRVFNGQPVYYRVETVCAPTRDTALTDLHYVNLKAGYKCYCFSQAVGGKAKDSSDIGGFSLAAVSHQDGGTHLQNPKAIYKRSDYTDNTPIDLDVDSIYEMKIFHSQRTDVHGDAKVTIFMDFNNNHVYDIPEDMVFTGYTTVGNFTLIDSVKVKAIAILNVPTGLRVILNNNIAPNDESDKACGVYTSGETEDYMIMFRKKGFTGVGTVSDLTGVGIYPNPTTGKFTVQYKGGFRNGDVKMTITNVTGQVVYSGSHALSNGQMTKELDMSGQAKGVYFVELNTGTETITRKLVVQ
jgi:hypothetical protein